MPPPPPPAGSCAIASICSPDGEVRAAAPGGSEAIPWLASVPAAPAPPACSSAAEPALDPAAPMPAMASAGCAASDSLATIGRSTNSRQMMASTPSRAVCARCARSMSGMPTPRKRRASGVQRFFLSFEPQIDDFDSVAAFFIVADGPADERPECGPCLRDCGARMWPCRPARSLRHRRPERPS